ncbi:hypothetical protein GCM10010520_62990 [Rhizobium viscosum]|uniref:Transmembrane protein n=1 Tax=Rhizobium viscosum TaxID=1673 RepID=A0ABR9IUY0_RHIVS|nr:hypothetical protein [Rhizobium viscosum]MBE1507014.1 hypothetical protein [Rhizobium viscosum]
MKDINLPQVDIFLLAYAVGMLVGHIPFLADGSALLLMALKVVLSVPVCLFVFVIYVTNAARIHRRPVFWSIVLFLVVLFLSVVLSLAWFRNEGEFRAFLIAASLALLVPSLATSCLCFAFMIRRRFRQIA